MCKTLTVLWFLIGNPGSLYLRLGRCCGSEAMAAMIGWHLIGQQTQVLVPTAPVTLVTSKQNHRSWNEMLVDYFVWIFASWKPGIIIFIFGTLSRWSEQHGEVWMSERRDIRPWKQVLSLHSFAPESQFPVFRGCCEGSAALAWCLQPQGELCG